MTATLLTFDCYGTLIDTAPFWQEIEKIGSEHGIDGKLLVNVFGSYEERLMYGEGLFTVYREIIYKALQYCEMDLGVERLTSDYGRLIKVHQQLAPYPEVIAALNALKAKGYKTAILSNSDWSIMKDNLRSLEHDFDAVYLAEDLHAYKPQFTFFKQVQTRLGSDRHIHIAAGFWWDIVPAQKMNWKRIWVNRKFKKGLQEYRPFAEVNTLDGVLNLL